MDNTVESFYANIGSSRGQSANGDVIQGFYSRVKPIPVAAPRQKPAQKPNFIQSAEQNIGNFFGSIGRTIKNDLTPNPLKGFNPTQSADKLTPTTLPSGLKLDFTTPSQTPSAKMQVTPKSLRQEAQSVKKTQQLMKSINTSETVKGIDQLVSDPLSLKSNPKKAISDAMSALKSDTAQWQKVTDFFSSLNTKQATSKKVGKGLQAVSGTAGIIFSPISALFSGANDIPVLGSVSRLITLPFTASAEGSTALSNKVIDSLPIPKTVKDNIKPGVGEIFALAAQLWLGRITEISAVKKADLIKKYGVDDANTIVEKAQELATVKKQRLLEAPKIAGFLEAKNPQSSIVGEGFTMSDTASKQALEVSKAQNEYQKALQDYNKNPTPAKLDKLRQLRERMFTPTAPKTQTVKDILKPGEYTPAEVRRAVLNSPLRNDPEAKQIIRESIKAEQQGQNINVSHGSATSSVGKTIEAKAIEDKLTQGLGDTAKYEASTFKEQAQKAADLINSGVDSARAVLRGEKPLPDGLRASSLLAAMQKYIEDNPKNAPDIQEMANSPLIGDNISKGAQEVSFSRMIEKDSATAKIQDLKKSRIYSAGGIDKVSKQKSSLKSAINKVHLSKEDLSWNNFLDSIKC